MARPRKAKPEVEKKIEAESVIQPPKAEKAVKQDQNKDYESHPKFDKFKKENKA